MSKKYILSYTINKILLQQVQDINSNINFILFHTLKKSNKNYLLDVFKVSFLKKKTNIFIYNTSIANLIVSLHSKLFHSSKIYFHLHDPKPHSGFLNIFIYIIQFIQVSISDTILVFDNDLVDDVKKYYFNNKKRVIVLKHGSPFFIKINTDINFNKINCGFFGRNMPYKNLSKFLYLVNHYPKIDFHIIGTGYNFENKYTNLKIHNRFIENDEYYSFMVDMDYIITPYKDISFSGIISDSIALNKKIVVSEYVFNKYFNENFIKFNEFIPEKIFHNKTELYSGWNEYSKNIKKIII